MQGEWIREINGSSLSVIFVHGFLSNGKDCWKNEQTGAYWPQLLQDQLSDKAIGIYVYTYQTDFFSGTYSLSDVVDDLKERLKLDGVLASRNLLFVCHSMGGIVVRKYLVSRQHDLNGVAVGLYLVASPSLGAEYANWLNPLATLMNHSQADVLRFSQNNQWLNDLNKEFKNLIGAKGTIIYGKEIIEDKFVTLKKFGWFPQVVPPVSGAVYFSEPYKLPGSDHFTIAKPEDANAMQHRLLIAFIKQHFHQNISVPVAPHISTVTPTNPSKTQTASPSLQPWQIKLKQKLIEQFQRSELKTVIESFFDNLIKDEPHLLRDDEAIADYLVAGSGDRHLHVAKFLSALSRARKGSAINELANEELFSYLLQIVVRKNREIDDQGLTRVPVESIEALKLIGASRTTTRFTPGQMDHVNGQKDPFSRNIGHYFPESGELNEIAVCNHIAKDLLMSLGYSGKLDESEDLMERLSGELMGYIDEPGNSPVQLLYLSQTAEHNPLHIRSIADTFREKLNNLIWIYIYGGNDPDAWLHVKESNLEGLINRFGRDKSGS